MSEAQPVILAGIPEAASGQQSQRQPVGQTKAPSVSNRPGDSAEYDDESGEQGKW
jgi:hypothetical protein